MGRCQCCNYPAGLPRNLLLASLVALPLCFSSAAAETGLELSGRDDTDPPPALWRLVDPANQKEVAKVKDHWGFAAAAPGEYELRLTPNSYPAQEIVWQRVTVPAAGSAKVFIRSGLVVTGRSLDDDPFYQIHVFRKGTKEKAGVLHRRWGYLPLPPGEYAMSLVPEDQGGLELAWTTFDIKEDEVAQVKVRSGVEVSGRSDEDDPPYRFHVFRGHGTEKVAVLHRRFGFAPLTAGHYAISLVPEDQGGLELAWTTFDIKEDEVAQVKVRSGVEVSGRSDEDDPPYRFHVFRAHGTEKVAVLHRRFGFAPLTAGQYAISLVPEDSGGLELPWTTFDIKEDEVAQVKVRSGVEVSGRSDEDDPPYRFHVFRADGTEKVAVLHRRFGFAPLTAGQYAISLVPEDSGGLELPWTTFEVNEDGVTSISITSGVDLSGRSAEDDPPYRFHIYRADTRERVAIVHRRFGFAPLTPGDYLIALHPEDSGAVELPWSTVSVESNSVTPLKIASGIDLVAAAPSDTPPADTFVLHARTGELANVWHRRWGYAMLPAGEYVVSTVAPGDDAAGKQKPVRVKRDEVLRLSYAELAPRVATERTGDAGAARAAPGHTTLELAWQPPPAADLDGEQVVGYRVYRAGAAAPIHGQRILQKPKFLDIGLTNGREYRYTIVAVLSGGGELKYAPITGTPGKETDSGEAIGPLEIVPGPAGIRPPSRVPPPGGAGIPR